jgi:hypothetical protein
VGVAVTAKAASIARKVDEVIKTRRNIGSLLKG